MRVPPMVRASHFHLYTNLLRKVGVPVARGLARSRLPSRIEETPGAFVSLPHALDFLAANCRDMTLSELGYFGTRHATEVTYGRALRRAVMTAPTSYLRMKALCQHAGAENSELSIKMVQTGRRIRLMSEMPSMSRYPTVCLAEWANLQAMRHVVRTALGPSWQPAELTFMSRFRLPDLASSEFALTRVLYGQPRTSILVDPLLLANADQRNNAERHDWLDARACADLLFNGEDPASPADGPVDWSFRPALRKLMQPYLADKPLDIEQAADLIGTSTRTLQRKLRQIGCSYKDIVKEARFGVALSLLRDPSVKIVDVAFAAGYQNQQHFTRAFRKYSGVTPSAFRREALQK